MKLSLSKLLISISFSLFFFLSFFFLSSFLIWISGGSKGSKLLYPKISFVSQSTIIFPENSSVKSLVDKCEERTPKIYGPGISNNSRFSLGKTVIHL